IYYRVNGIWRFAGWTSVKNDVGVLVVRRRVSTHSLDIAFIGYTGRSTEMLGDVFLGEPNQFQPSLDLRNDTWGMWLCEFGTGNFAGELTPKTVAPPTVIDLAKIDLTTNPT